VDDLGHAVDEYGTADPQDSASADRTVLVESKLPRVRISRGLVNNRYIGGFKGDGRNREVVRRRNR